jgi:hypothetical protein
MSDGGVFAELDPARDPRWDEFVSGHPAATVYHHSAWTQFLCETYGHTPLYLGLLSADRRQLMGVLPFVFVNSLLTGKRLVCLPFTSYCNPLMPGSRLDGAIRHGLNRFEGVQHAELKLLQMQGEDEDMAAQGVESPFVSQILRLTGDIDELFRTFHNTSIRQMVRRAVRDGLGFRLADTESELRRFYELVVEVRRGEGLPSPPYKFYANMRRLLSPKGLFELPVVEINGSIVAAAVILKGRVTWHYEYGASDARLGKRGANQLLVWECIKRAHEAKAKFFDFGRTSLWHRSLLMYKDHWHTERCPIRYRFFPDDVKAHKWHDVSDNFLVRLNRRLPTLFLKWEGRLIYPHRS